MAYVPGLEFDVFLSYSHADNQSHWVTAFEAALTVRLQELVGPRAKVWRDQRQLSGEQDFNDEIKTRLAKSGVLVALVSPSYLASNYCRLERREFARHRDNQLKLGNRWLVLKAIKTPSEGNTHRQFLPDCVGFEFYREPDGDASECFPGDADFRSAIDKLAKGVRNVLRELVNQRTPVYVAEPSSEVEGEWNGLCDQLRADGFRVLPTYRLDSEFEADAIRNEISPASLSVHLLGPRYDDFAVTQLDIAATLEKQRLVWMPPAVKAESRQEQLLERLAAAVSIQRNLHNWKLAGVVADLLRSKTGPEAATVNGGGTKVYLICDRTDKDETDRALRLRERMEQERFEVFLPDVDRDAAILEDEHFKRLAACDGVLLYWGCAGQEWFMENYTDLKRADRRLRVNNPFRSKAIFLDEPNSPAKSAIPRDSLVIHQLEPFLEPLRARRGMVGH